MATGSLLTRPAAFAVIAAVHVAGVALIGFGGPVSIPTRAATIAVHDVANAPVPQAEPVLKLAAVTVDVSAPEVTIADSNPIAGGDCAVIDTLQSALANDPAVVGALAALSVDRSAANAVAVWNARWASSPDVVRAAVVSRLATLPVSCREAIVTGPRLLIIDAGDHPVALAFGSGAWRWADLMPEREVST